jgi:hypothetical protein
MTTMQQLVVGIFRDHAQAEHAVNELLGAGFDQQQIRFAGQGSSTGGILEKIKNVFTGQDTSAGGAYNDLVSMGAPSEDARYYQSEFEAGRSIVAVTGAGGLQEAITILARNGGYGANQRFAQSADYDRNADAMAPANENMNTDYNRSDPNQRFAQSADYNGNPDAQAPANENMNTDYNRSDPNQRFAQSADYDGNPDAQAPVDENVNTDYNRSDPNQRFAQSADYDRNADAMAPANEDVNTAYNRSDLQQQGATSMQESQQTNTSNTYYNLVSALYHALQTEQTTASYVQDAQQSGDDDLKQFFSDIQQNASQQAGRARELLGRTNR